MTEEEIFQAAAALPGAQRAAYLLRICEGQPDLRKRVLDLLSSNDDAGFMQAAADPTVLAALDTDRAQWEPEQCGERIGNYKLLQQIGEGGCGLVYMAEQEKPVRRTVALKILKLGTDTKSVIARFQQERQALAMMDHPNIARVFDAGATPHGRPYFVMELVRGIRITDFCDQNNMSTIDRLELFIAVCQAIQHAHQKGIIHRDIKPSNILVTLNDGVPIPKVIDFGIAKATSGQRLIDQTLFTAFQQFVGTPAYMSPEQAEMSALDVDTRSDIYSLGVLLYELLTGQTPFDGQALVASGLDAMRKTIRETEPLRPSTRLTQALVAASMPQRTAAEGLAIPSEAEATADSRRRLRVREQINRLRGDLDWIVMKCLEKDRARRYDTANGLALDLKRHLSNEPVLARPASASYKFQKAWRRNKLVFTAAAAVVAALVIGISLSTWYGFEARKQRTAAQIAAKRAQEERNSAENARGAEQKARLEAIAKTTAAEYESYVAKINLARQAWEEGHMERLLQSLKETSAFPNRGFEWYHWQRQAHLQLKTLWEHAGPITSVGFSPDGDRIVTGSWDQTARVWDTASGRELFKLLGHSAAVQAVAFVPPGGQRIVTAGEDQTARIWDAATHQELFRLIGHNGWVSSVALPADGRFIATGGHDHTVRVWEGTTGRHLRTLVGHTQPINGVAFSPDGQLIGSASSDKTARLWDVATGLTLHGFDLQSTALSVAFSPNGQRFVTGTVDGIRFWDAATGHERPIEVPSLGPIASLAFSQDGRRLVSGSWITTAQVWDAVAGGKPLGTFGMQDTVLAVAFAPDCQHILVAGGDDPKIWEASNGRESLTLHQDKSGVLAIAISPDGRWIVTGGTPDVSTSVADTGPESAQVFDTSNGKLLRQLKGHSSGIASVTFSPDGLRIATGSGDGTARIWETVTGRPLSRMVGHIRSVSSLAFSPDGRRLVTGGQDDSVRLWEVSTGRSLHEEFLGHTEKVTSVAFSRDGQRILSGSDDSTARLWDAETGRELCQPFSSPEMSKVMSVAFSPDEHRIAAVGWHRVGIVWEVASRREVFKLVGHRAPVSSVAFSKDGQRIVTASFDVTARVWDAATGRELLMLPGHGRELEAVVFSPDGRRIFTGSMDRTVKVWEAASAEQVATWAKEDETGAQLKASSSEELTTLLREHDTQQRRQRIALARHDPGVISRWLVLAPIPLARADRGLTALDLEQIEGEGRLRPKVGDVAVIGGRELKWREVIEDDYVTDFGAIVGHEIPHSLAYAVCYIESETERHGLQIRLGSDDGSKLFLNGNPVYQTRFQRAFLPDQDQVPDISLNAGLNVLVFKVLQGRGWKGAVRLTDPQGSPVAGVRITLDPGTKP